MKYSVIAGTGSFLPERVVSNDALAAELATRDISTSDVDRRAHRHPPAPSLNAVSPPASWPPRRRAAMADAGVEASEIDLIVLATSTPKATSPTGPGVTGDPSCAWTARPSSSRPSRWTAPPDTCAEAGVDVSEVDWLIPPGQRPHPEFPGAQAQRADREGRHHRRPACQYLRGQRALALDAARRRPRQARPAHPDARCGRRFHLGLGARPHVKAGACEAAQAAAAVACRSHRLRLHPHA